MSEFAVSWRSVVLAGVVVLAAAGAVGWLWAHDFQFGAAVTHAIDLLRAAGPWTFFSAMAVLPALGCPLLAFHLTAASAFAPQMGMGGVIAAAGVAIAVNIALTYWLACYGLRPWLEQLIARTPYKIPQLDAADHAEITVVLRVTPGPPFFLQGYLLGLAGVRFSTYMWISWVIAMAYATGFIIFGDAILHGKAGAAIGGLGAIVAVALIFHILRRHYGKKRA
jgi:uncharacterized membrane protein YdjX (TVP38/TMEM64 family)